MTTHTLRVIADENILGLDSCFSHLLGCNANIVTLPGRQISQQNLIDCDVLLVRSVTPVNEKLLEGTAVKFVGTATSGVEHIDEPYLRESNIKFCHAKGANANAVAEYVVTSLAELSLRFNTNYFSQSIGIVGHGFVGKALEKKLQAFSCPVKKYDPYLAEQHPQADYQSWDTIANCTVVSCHVPYTHSAKYPTQNLFNNAFFDKFSNQGVFINAARGEICDEKALLHKSQISDIKTVLDVWNNEPAIDLPLLNSVALGSAHIAGYSADAKLQATHQLVDSLTDFFSIDMQKNQNNCTPNQTETIDFINHNSALNDKERIKVESLEDVFNVLVSIYPISEDHKKLSNISEQTTIAQHFDQLRKGYNHRLEWSNYSLDNMDISEPFKSIFSALGFQIKV